MNASGLKDSENRITERQNELTKFIDVASVPEMLRSLRSCDSQIFRGYNFYESIYDRRIVNNIIELSYHVSTILTGEKKGKIIFSGCGTSGRVGFLCSRNYNKLFPKMKPFGYVMAGTDEALMTSQEEPEDFPEMGEDDLKNYIQSLEGSCEKIVFIGISCGLSALYVGGQLEFFLKHSDLEKKPYELVSSIIGFNPSHLARKSDVPYWEKKSFQNLLDEIIGRKFKDFYVLNPVVGPEAIQGSSRMKGGSATKILLDVIFEVANYFKDHNIPHENTQTKEIISMTRNIIRNFELTYQHTYEQIEKISSVVNSVGMSLRNENGSVCYLGQTEAGIWGLVDCSEMVDTYGLKFDDVRGFISQGWANMGRTNTSGKDMRRKGKEYHMSYHDFKNENDVVKEEDRSTTTFIFLVIDDGILDLSENYDMLKFLLSRRKREKQQDSNIHCIWISDPLKESYKNENIQKEFMEKLGEQNFVYIEIPRFGRQQQSKHNHQYCSEFSLKLIVNNITTLGNVLNGVTYENIMINFKLANTKLIQRSIDIVGNILKVSPEVAKKYVLRAIYENEDDEENDKKSFNLHVKKATDMDSIIPIAILLLCSHHHEEEEEEDEEMKCKNVEDAKLMLGNEPIIRNLITKLVKKK